MSMLRLPALAALLALAVAACAPTLGPPPPPPGSAPPSATVFRPEDFSWSAVPGRNSIDGRLTYRQGATRYICSGAGVVLTPETPCAAPVVPQVLSNFASYALLRFEINVRGASVMGFVGAGGIGQDLIEAIRKFYYADVSAILVLIIATVMVIDLLTERLRHRLIGREART